ncbi:TPA: DNA-directed RNA polymerase subunit beta, partial [Salmonella enterica subsp. enterica serovar Typhimurium var. 5-]|nr:DNA-directed RNA polymerase subunit beta [Salmonella enterica subsp. enterica serovar Typhimurium var. 5-]
MTGQLVQYGRHRQRRSYARISEVLELPNLIEIQTSSYQWFLDEGLREMFQDISPIEDFTGNLSLEFIDYSLGEPKYPVEESKERDVTYSAPLRVKVRLVNKETGEVKDQDVFMGDFPLMTETGTFVINGAERVIVSQLVRSPSVYYSGKLDKNGKKGFSATVIPNRGAWLEYETDAKDVVYVRIDRTRKLPVTVLLRALGFGSDQEIIDLIGDNEYIRNTLEKDNTESTEKALLEIYERLRPGEPPTVDNAKSLLVSRFFDPKRYDLANVGRYKINKKLHIKNRLFGQKLAETLVDPETGEIIAEKGVTLDRRTLDKIIPALENNVGFKSLSPYGGVVEEDITLQSIKIYAPNDEGEKEINVLGNAYVPEPIKNITPADIIASISY